VLPLKKMFSGFQQTLVEDLVHYFFVSTVNYGILIA
jgi:hypothetical protein